MFSEGKTKPVEGAQEEKSVELRKMEQYFYIYVSYEKISSRLVLYSYFVEFVVVG